MKARNNPTPAQILRRLRRHPNSDADPRYRNDAYWALRLQGHPHAYAKRAFRDEPPKIDKQEVGAIAECDPDDILFPLGSTFTRIEVTVRPPLTEEVVANARPRRSEYTIWDDTISGFGLRVRPSGYKSFVLFYRQRGDTRLRKFTIGRAGNLTLEAASEAARQRLYEALGLRGVLCKPEPNTEVD